MRIESYFVPKGKRAEKLIKWKSIPTKTKGIVEVPESFSETATEVLANKYLRRISNEKSTRESSFKQIVERIVLAIGKSGKQQGVFKTSNEVKIFSEELKFILFTQRAAFNSPVWFNVGLFEAYKFKGGDGLFYYDAKKKKALKSKFAFERPQCSACFIQSVSDDLDDIFELAKTEAKLFKYGSGSGSNFSNWRSKYEELQGGGTSSGLISFLDVLDRGAGAIRSGGTTRHAAKMVCIDMDHPEIEEFITWKQNEEKKAEVLVNAGYSRGLDGEAYRTVSGQNANTSVRVSDRFLRAVQSQSLWSLIKRTDKKVARKVPAAGLWQKLAESAWSCGDPGVQFDDTIQKWHTCAKSERINASNPCSEYMFIDDTACNLSSLNLVKYLSKTGEFLWDDFEHSVRLLTIAQEILVGYSGYPTEKIAARSNAFRTLGLGFANLGGLFIRMGISYESEISRAWAASISAVLTGTAYITSATLASELGAFREYSKNKQCMQKVLKMHQKAAFNLKSPSEDIRKKIKLIWQEAIRMGKKYGFRNAQVTAIAPTGTIGLLMDCDTFGIEPEFSLSRVKFLVGGGEIHSVNRSVESGLRALGYEESTRKSMLAELETSGSLTVRAEHEPVFLTAQPNAAGRQISPMGHLQMVAAVQPFVSGAISKTINLPSNASIDDVQKIYENSHKMQIKAVSIYRDQSKNFQPLQQKNTMICPECKQGLVRTGNCLSCPSCGYSMACG